jgi:hypothetical protein
MATTLQVAFDAADPHALAAFWAAAVRYQVEVHEPVVRQLLEAGRLPEEATTTVNGSLAFRDVAAASDTEGRGPRLFFQRVPEGKAAKNRVHLDLQVGAEAAPAEIERLVALGAQVLWTTSDRGPLCTTLADPEGNELCVS